MQQRGYGEKSYIRKVKFYVINEMMKEKWPKQN